MKWLKVDNLMDVLKHFSLVIAICFALVIGFFYIYLPAKTNHGETITVPDLTGLSVNDLDEFLLQRNLRYEISDSSYELEMPPLTVLRQFPKPGSRVKESRKIYLTVNRETPPEIRLPDNIIGSSLKNAMAVLSSIELRRGKINYIPYPYSNLVLEMKLNGKNLTDGDRVPKGSSIDLIVGDGGGRKKFTMEDLTSRILDDVKITIMGQGLKLGVVTGQKDSLDSNWIVSKQIPEAGQTVNIGQFVDLWVQPFDSLMRKDDREPDNGNDHEN